MTRPKVHLETGLFGKAACGKQNVDTTREPTEVTCVSCRKTDHYIEAWTERASVVGNP